MKQIILQAIDADELYQQIRLIVKEEINAAESQKNIASNHLTAIEFMSAIKIRRTKFDELVKDDKIQIIKKGRRIYVPRSEVARYFEDTSSR